MELDLDAVLPSVHGGCKGGKFVPIMRRGGFRLITGFECDNCHLKVELKKWYKIKENPESGGRAGGEDTQKN